MVLIPVVSQATPEETSVVVSAYGDFPLTREYRLTVEIVS